MHRSVSLHTLVLIKAGEHSRLLLGGWTNSLDCADVAAGAVPVDLMSRVLTRYCTPEMAKAGLKVACPEQYEKALREAVGPKVGGGWRLGAGGGVAAHVEVCRGRPAGV